MQTFPDVASASAAADERARTYGGVWVVHSIPDEARTRLSYVAVNAALGWHLPVHYRTDRPDGEPVAVAFFESLEHR